MKNKIFNTIGLVIILSNIAYSQQGFTTYDGLLIGVDENQIDNTPYGVKLGVNGQVFIQDSRGAQQRNIKEEYRQDFMLYVEKGVMSEDLGIAVEDIWLPDYVFENDYELPSLEYIENYVKEHKHLPGIIGKKELEEKGHYRVNKMLLGQLKTIEELLLHTINQEKDIKAMKIENEMLKTLANELEMSLKKLEGNK